MPGDDRPPRFASLAKNLQLLGSEPRLELLHGLRQPQALHEIRARAALTREGEREGRPMARQSLTDHLDQLVEAGLVLRVDAAGERGDRFVLNHERLFALVHEIRNLSKLRPIQVPSEPAATLEGGSTAAPKLPEGPRLVVTYGRDEGVAFALQTQAGKTWRIGRSPECEVRLDYDPFLSSEHTTISASVNGLTISDADSRNGTWVNWRQLRAGEVHVLKPGDVIMAGRSLLVFQT